ncbi:hypothetical protein [Caminibacter sp.]
MVIEIKDKQIEKLLKILSYEEIEKLINETLKEKIEDIRDYIELKKTRNEEKIDFEKFLNENNN